MSLYSIISNQSFKPWANLYVNDVNMTGDLTIAGTVTFAGNVDIGGDLGVAGNTVLSQDLGVLGDTTLAGDVGLGANLAVTGDVTLNGTVDQITFAGANQSSLTKYNATYTGTIVLSDENNTATQNRTYTATVIGNVCTMYIPNGIISPTTPGSYVQYNLQNAGDLLPVGLTQFGNACTIEYTSNINNIIMDVTTPIGIAAAGQDLNISIRADQSVYDYTSTNVYVSDQFKGNLIVTLPPLTLTYFVA